MNDYRGVAQSAQGGKFEKDIYYRRPVDADENPGWITTGAQKSGTALRDYTMRGFEPLWKYGSIPHDEPNRWKTILTHPDGPAEFPADQILSLRWYEEKECPVPGVRFPQIAGAKVREYRCPICKGRKFVQVNGRGGIGDLGNHLAIIHKWDRQSIRSYGEEIGVDFTDTEAVTDIVTDVKLNVSPEPEAEPGVDLLERCNQCDYEGTPNQVRGHKMGAHKERVPA